MSNKERARECICNGEGVPFILTAREYGYVTEKIAQALDQAEKRAYEDAARIAENYDSDFTIVSERTCQAIAKVIRSRGERNGE